VRAGTALVVGTVLTAACAVGSSTTSVPPRPAHQPGTELGTVRVGALFPITGSRAAAGLDGLHGAQLAADILNGRHPEIDLDALRGAQIDLVAADSGTDGQTAQGVVDRLVRSEQVVALTGAEDSNVTLAASQRAELLGVPMVTGSASAPELTERGARWLWRVGPSERTDIESYFQWLKAIARDHPVAHVVVLRPDSAGGDEAAALVAGVAPHYNVQMDEDVRYSAPATDLSAQVLRLKGYAPDALFVYASSGDAGLMLRTMARVGYTPPALLALDAGLADPELARTQGRLAEFAVTRSHWSPEVVRSNPIAEAVANAFRAQFGTDLDATSACDFEAMMALGMAIEAAGSTDPARLQSALRGLHVSRTITTWQGIQFDASGQNRLASAVIEQLTGSEYHVIYPPPAATAKLVWPLPALDKR
jgi:branched-chain amino acid transport system substrate-binding protein